MAYDGLSSCADSVTRGKDARARNPLRDHRSQEQRNSLPSQLEREVAAGCLITVAEIRMTQAVKVEEHVHGGTVWVAIRARGAEWSWLTQEEAARLGREWAARYGSAEPEHTPMLLAAE
jgi:hypothetical protein